MWGHILKEVGWPCVRAASSCSGDGACKHFVGSSVGNTRQMPGLKLCSISMAPSRPCCFDSAYDCADAAREVWELAGAASHHIAHGAFVGMVLGQIGVPAVCGMVCVYVLGCVEWVFALYVMGCGVWVFASYVDLNCLNTGVGALFTTMLGAAYCVCDSWISPTVVDLLGMLLWARSVLSVTPS